MIAKLKSVAGRHLLNMRGWRTSRKIVVIESDDWGSIRMPSKEVYNALLKAGISVDKCAYNRYDSLASEADLEHLFGSLSGFKDKNGNPPVITANTIMANPDFERIKEAYFEKYFHEPFTNTLARYPACSNSFSLWKEGMGQNVFFPQLHGREHLNIGRWMRALKDNLPETRLAFEHELFGLSTTITREKRRSFLAAFDYDHEEDRLLLPEIIHEAAWLFEKHFGYRSTTFIAPNYFWDDTVELALNKEGICYLQGARVQQTPVGSPQKPVRHYTGNTNSKKQLYLVRNCLFEPSLETHKENVVERCLEQIKTAFLWGKPAIISSHRLNYIGSIDVKNRDQNLLHLKRLIAAITTQWEDVEFMTSPQLGELIAFQ